MPSSASFFRARIQLALLTLVFGLAAFVPPASGQSTGSSYRSGEILIKFRPGTSVRDEDAILADLGAARIRRLNLIGASYERISGLSVAQAVARYRGDRRVEFIEPNYIHHAIAAPNDPFFGQLWGMENLGQTGGTPGADIHAPLAWDVFTGSSSVLVAIIDTGIDYTHEDLAANIFVNPGEVAGNGIDDDDNGFIDDVHGWDFANGDNDPMDDHGHGTHVAGTIGAVGNNGIGVVGVNWSVRLMPLKFLAGDGFGSDADAISCIEYATLMGVKILNNSWGGGGYSQALYDAIQAAGAAGVLFVAAAGNSGANNDLFPEYPASYDLPNILSVASTDHNDHLSGFSNYGLTSVDVAAPGSNILSTLPYNGYGFLSGTSMATPHVAGVAALILGRFPAIQGPEIKNLILASADAIPALSGLMLTGARLNALLPIAEPDSLPPDPITDVSVAQVDGNWARLQWTATGDDGATGRAARYDVRFSTAPITAGNFAFAQVATGPPSPVPAGGTQQMRVNGLAFSTPYYFALRVFDELGNVSGISNIASATTLGPPDIGTSPDSFAADLLTGETSTQMLTIQNTGVSELAFQITSQPVTTQASTRRATLVPPIVAARSPPTTAIASDPGSTTRPSYASGHVPLRPPGAVPRKAPPSATSAGSIKILLLQSGGDVSELRNVLLAFPDIDQVDVYDGGVSTPSLVQLQAYGTVIAIANSPYANGTAVGDVLADYVDGGGGVVLTLATFINGFEIGGRFLSGGYFPFQLGSGPAGFSTLGTFDSTHPIMQGVTACAGDLLGNVTVSPGAYLVASWANGFPLVATLGNRVAAVNLFFGAGGFWTGDVPLLMRNAALWARGAADFLSVEPSSGVIPPGGSVQVEVVFDATGLDGGDYRAILEVASNDPDESLVTVPALLHVTGAPDIAVSSTSLNFGQVFVGFSSPETLVVRNAGTDLLTVKGVSATPGEYSVPVAGFALAPGESRNLIVTFAPLSAAVIPGSLQITSDDPDEGVVNVALLGQGLIPPDISVAPESLSVALLTGETATRSLTVHNSGGSHLAFTVSKAGVAVVGPSTGALAGRLRVSARAVASQPVASFAGAGSRGSTTVAQVTGRTNTGTPHSVDVRTLANSSPPRTLVGSGTLVISTTGIGRSIERALQELGHAYDLVYANDFTSIDFTPYDTILVTLDGGSVSEASCLALANAVSAGRLLFMVGGTADPPYYAGMQSYLLEHTGEQGWTISGPPHLNVVDPLDPLSEGLPASTTFLNQEAAFYMLRIADPAATVVAVNGDGHPALVHKTIGSGQLVYLIDSPFDNYWLAEADYQVLKRVVRNVYAFGEASWLSVDPRSGDVPAGGDAVLQVEFDATGLNGGDYRAEIQIASNDPDESLVAVPVHLHVTGAPDIQVSSTSLDFGQVFVGFSSPETLIVKNAGTDLLTVTGVSAAPGDYSAPGAGFTLSPGESHSLYVTFAPLSAAVIPGSLQITSDDPDEGVVNVALLGHSLLPPDISVAPESLSVALLTGETATRSLTVHNSGGSHLAFTVSEAGVAVVGPSSGALAGRLRVSPRAVASRGSTTVAQVTGRTNTGTPHSVDVRTLASSSPPRALVGSGTLVISTAGIAQSIERALQELGHAYDLVFTDDFTSIDFTPYNTILVTLDGGSVSEASCLALANAVSAGRLLFMVGGTNYSPYYAGMQSYLLKHTGEQGWTISGPPHLNVVDPLDPLSEGLPASTTFVNEAAAYYMLRINDPAATVAAVNGYGHPALVHKAIGSGQLVYFTSPPDDVFWSFAQDFAILKQVVRNAYAASGALWLSVDPRSGDVPVGGDAVLQVEFDATGLNGGDYQAEIQIASNDPDESLVAVPVHLHVTGAPDIAVSPGAVTFPTTFIGVTATSTVVVSNLGSDLLMVSGLGASPAVFGVPTGGFTVAPRDSHFVAVTFSPSSAGPIAGSLVIQSNDVDEATVTVPLDGVGDVPPDIGVLPPALLAILASGHQETQSLQVSNTNGSLLHWSLTIQNGPPVPNMATGSTRATRPAASAAVPEARSGAATAAPSGPSGLEGLLHRQLLQAGPGTVFYDDMEHGANGWTREVYAFDDLWHQTNRAFNSPSTSWWCGQEVTGNYYTGNTISTAAVSPSIDLTHVTGPLTLEFYETFETEPGYDFCMVDVRFTPNPNWISLRGGIGVAPSGSSGGWRLSALDLTPFRGKVIQLRFYFDTIDPVANFYSGWFFDDVRVGTSGPVWLSVTPTSGSLAAGQSQTLNVLFDATGLDPGTTFEGQIHLTSNDPDEPLVSVPATLVVAGPTATEISLVSSTVEPGRVQLKWHTADASVQAAVHRRTTDGEWAQVGSVAPGGNGFLIFEDRSVAPGTRYGYRVVVVDGGHERFLGETWVDVPERAVLALYGLASDPAAQQDLSVAFSLPTAGSATLELLDLAGRRLRSIDVGGFGAGRHLASLGRSRAYPSGIYLIRLRHAEGALVAKCAIVR